MNKKEADNNNNNDHTHSDNETNNNKNSGSNPKNIEFVTSKKNLLLNNKKDKKYAENINNNLTFISGFIRSKSGIAGVVILLILISMTVYAFFGIPFASFKEWNNPNYWIDNPRLASPIWSDFFGFFGRNIPEHLILSSSIDNNDRTSSKNKVTIYTTNENGITVVTHSYHINYNSDIPPND